MSTRNAELAKIHLGKKQLALGDDAYRDMLWTVARVRSAKDLDEHQRHAVIKHLVKCGATFERPKKAGTRPHNYDRLPEYITKVEALLADMGLPWSYADTIARNITGGRGNPELEKDPGVEKLAWVKGDKHWRAIIAALSVEREKRGLLAGVDLYLEHLGKDRAYLRKLFPKLPRGWERNRSWLRAISNELVGRTGEG
ncbi:MAG: regulatory protein GemA [Chromatiales bacterium]|nr:regulatory protein GemA [Chromatiales bacterium]